MAAESGVTEPEARVGVAIVDNHPLFRLGLREQLETDPAIEVVAEFGTAVDAVRKIPDLRPSVTLMDLHLPWKNGVPQSYCGADAIKLIREKLPDAPIAVITMFFHRERVREALKAGARSFLLKDGPEDQIVQKVRLTAQGVGVIDPEVVGAVRDLMPVSAAEATLFSELSPRENQILHLAATGQDKRGTARELGITAKTVDNYWASILRNLGVSSREEAIGLARGNGHDQDEEPPPPGPAG